VPALEVFPDPQSLFDAAAEVVIRRAADSIAASGRVTLVLAGGSTPEGLYRRLASRHCRDRIAWPHVHLFWGDERCVPPEDPASNYRMAREALLDHVPVRPAQVHRMRGEDVPGIAAADYEALVRGALGGRDRAGAGGFDLVLLGLGADGHTASLFPGRDAPRETARWVVAEHVGADAGWRITLTLPALTASTTALFLVSGAGKAEAVAAVLEGSPDAPPLPAQLVVARHGDVRWMMDRPAACRLAAVDGRP
jgi:6-phosphogluconolactonase